MKKEITIIIVLFLAAILFTYFYSFSYKETSINEVKQVCIENNCFNVEVVSSGEERQKGLMFRESLDEKAGMLFVFETTDNYPFWMKNTLIPLDMIWITDDLLVTSILEADPCEADPCKIYDPSAKALYVLEINQGLSEELGFKIGDKVNFK